MQWPKNIHILTQRTSLTSYRSWGWTLSGGSSSSHPRLIRPASSEPSQRPHTFWYATIDFGAYVYPRYVRFLWPSKIAKLEIAIFKKKNVYSRLTQKDLLRKECNALVFRSVPAEAAMKLSEIFHREQSASYHREHLALKQFKNYELR